MFDHPDANIRERKPKKRYYVTSEPGIVAVHKVIHRFLCVDAIMCSQLDLAYVCPAHIVGPDGLPTGDIAVQLGITDCHTKRCDVHIRNIESNVFRIIQDFESEFKKNGLFTDPTIEIDFEGKSYNNDSFSYLYHSTR